MGKEGTKDMTRLTPLELQIRHRPCRYSDCPICEEGGVIDEVARQLTSLGFHVTNVAAEMKQSFASIEVEESETDCARLLRS